MAKPQGDAPQGNPSSVMVQGHVVDGNRPMSSHDERNSA